MPYGFNEQTSTTGGGSYIDTAGFYSARVASVAFENSKNDGSGKMVLAIKFETPEGASFRHIEWDVQEETIRTNAAKYFAQAQQEGKPKTDRTGKILTLPQFQQKSVDDEYEAQGARIKHIAEAYGGGKGNLTATSYQDYANKVVAMFNSLDTSEYKPLMIVYNSKDYASLPRYAPFFGGTESALRARAAAKPKAYRFEKNSADSDEYGSGAPAPAAGGRNEEF